MTKIIRDFEALEELTPHVIGAILADSRSDQQASAFNAMARESQDWSPIGRDMQWHELASELSPEAIEMLESIVSYAKGDPDQHVERVQVDRPDGDIESISFLVGDVIKEKIMTRLFEYFDKHEAYDGESICQLDRPTIESPSVLADIADNILQFKVKYRDD